ncbi:MAG: nitroreductase family protein [Chloroflexota bacterium]
MMDLSTPENLEILDHLLTTTRSVRKRLDLERPVEPEVIERCLEIAGQAPTGSNQQNWSFMVVNDTEKRAKIAEYYKQNWYKSNSTRSQRQRTGPDAPSETQVKRLVSSAMYLADHFHEVPVLIIGCYQGRPDDPSPRAQAGMYGSILPAMWSLMMALRARGLGAAWTTLHLPHEKEIADLLGIPDDVTQAALLPVAYFKGDDFKPAKRLPISERTFWDSWGNTREK